MNRDRVESLGPAERVVQALLQHADHMVHNRPGVVVPVGWVVAFAVFEKAEFGEPNACTR